MLRLANLFIYFRLEFNENGSITADLMNKFWGNFAHYGKPSNDDKLWPPYTEKSLVSC